MKILLHLTLFFCSCFLTAQTTADQQKARSLGNEAVELMDDGQYDASRELLLQAQKLDPVNPVYPYELGYAYYLEGNYKGTIKVLKKVSKSENTIPRIFTMLGNSYDNIGKQKQAIKAYEAGMKRYPNSGLYYVELGILELRRNDINRAAGYWESGIRADPNYASNYFHLANLFAQTEEHIWTVLYGEMFLNLEPGTARTEIISKVIYGGYRNAIELNGDTARVDFVQNMTMNVEDLLSLKLPAPMVFGTTMMMATVRAEGEDDVNCTTLHALRSAFLENWYAEGHQETYPNPVIERMKTIATAGHQEAYDHWLVREGDPVGWEFWVDANKEAFNAFAEWFQENPASVEKGEGLTRSSF